MRIVFLPIYLIIAFQLKAQVIMQQDAPALLQKCLKNTKNQDPTKCTKQHILNLVVNEINLLEPHQVKSTLPININLSINERGALTDIKVNKNTNAFENKISNILQRECSFFPARKNSNFIPSSLTYVIDQQVLIDHNLLNQKGNLIVTYHVEDLIPVPREEMIDMVPFAIVEDPPTTKKCTKKPQKKKNKTAFLQWSTIILINTCAKNLKIVKNIATSASLSYLKSIKPER